MLLRLPFFMLASPVLAFRIMAPGGQDPDQKAVSLKDGNIDCGSVPLPPWADIEKHIMDAKVYSLRNTTNSTDTMNRTAIVTYAGLEKQSYIDGAVVLGRSLVRLNLGVELWCLVHKTMADDDKRLLQRAGWKIQEEESWLPEHWIQGQCGYWRDSYNKVDIFRLPFQKVLYFDADTLVLGNRSDIDQILKPFLSPMEVKMVKDVNGKDYNSGVLVFQPTLETFRAVHKTMARGQLDQPAINEAYKGRIRELPFKYNVHGYGTHDCNSTVIAHFTGLHKPSEASMENMKRVFDGAYPPMDHSSLNCSGLYVRYFSEMTEQVDYLSPTLQKLLSLPEVATWGANSSR